MAKVHARPMPRNTAPKLTRRPAPTAPTAAPPSLGALRFDKSIDPSACMSLKCIAGELRAIAIRAQAVAVLGGDYIGPDVAKVLARLDCATIDSLTTEIDHIANGLEVRS